MSMALIAEFERSTADGSTRSRTRVSCAYRTVEVDGIKAVQLITFGSSERKLAGKASQVIEIDREHASQLVEILRESFPGI